VDIHLQREQGMIELEVRDNGRGISREEVSRAGSLGLLSMRERAFALGGEVTIGGRAGVGTTVTARIPVRFQNAQSPTAAARKPADAARRGSGTARPGRRKRKG
jgi:signal transduction histidine kinase